MTTRRGGADTGRAVPAPAPAPRMGGWAPPRAGIPPCPKPRDDDDDDADAEGRPRLPQAVAHRGYSAVAPENTMEAFRRAVEAGAHALETDLRLSRDGVVLLMHDPSLKRTFGVNSKVRDHEWGYLRELRTLRKPHEPMARLVDLLRYLNEPGLERIWVMLDVKRDGDPDDMMRRIADVVASVPAKTRPWSERLQVCCWNAAFVRQAQKHMPPGTPLAHVGFSPTYARALARRVPGLSLSLLRLSLASPLGGARFIREARRQRTPLFSWTVNGEAWMRWAVRARLDGVVTDDPALFREVCRRVAAEGGGGESEEVHGGSGSGNSNSVGVAVAAGKEKQQQPWAGETLWDGVKFAGQIALIEVIHLIWLIILFLRQGGPGREVQKSLEG